MQSGRELRLDETRSEMKYETAVAYANEITDLLRPFCTRIEIAGGVRRHKESPHDIEIVCIPRIENKVINESLTGGKTTVDDNRLDDCIKGAVDSGIFQHGEIHSQKIHLWILIRMITESTVESFTKESFQMNFKRIRSRIQSRTNFVYIRGLQFTRGVGKTAILVHVWKEIKQNPRLFTAFIKCLDIAPTNKPTGFCSAVLRHLHEQGYIWQAFGKLCLLTPMRTSLRLCT